MIKIFIFALSTFFVVNGCTTQPIQQGKNLSSSGIAYTDAINSLLEVTADRIIEFDTEELKKTRRGPNLKQMITEKNDAVLDLLGELSNIQAQTKLLKTYFLNLQALADSPVRNDAGSAVQALSSSISSLNRNSSTRLTDEQKQQIGALGGLVANSLHSAKIKRALTRDAEIIGRYLSLQENQLEIVAGILKDRFEADNDLFLQEEVIAPYVDKQQDLGPDWEANRKQWLEARLINQQLSTAQEAAKQLRGVWADILQGKTDINALSVLISNINEFVTSVEGLDAASKIN